MQIHFVGTHSVPCLVEACVAPGGIWLCCNNAPQWSYTFAHCLAAA